MEHDRYKLGAAGAILPRIEQGRLPRQDEVYRFWAFPVHMPRVAAAASVFDEEEEEPGLGEMTGEALRYHGEEPVLLEPSDGAWIRSSGRSINRGTES